MNDRKSVSAALVEISDLLSASGEKNRFRLNAYKKGAGVVLTMADFEKATFADIKGQPGIGEALAEKIIALRDTGHLPFLEEFHASRRWRS